MTVSIHRPHFLLCRCAECIAAEEIAFARIVDVGTIEAAVDAAWMDVVGKVLALYRVAPMGRCSA
jgi:hypothetical protein